MQLSKVMHKITRNKKETKKLQRKKVQAQREMDPGSSKRIRSVGLIQETKTLDPTPQNAGEHGYTVHARACDWPGIYKRKTKGKNINTHHFLSLN